MEPIEFGKFDLVLSEGNISGGASALQWGPDGLLYAVGRQGFVYAIEVEKQTDAQGETTGYTGEIKWTHDLSAPNFNDAGEFENNGNRQALGIVVTEDEVTGETVVYASHSDIKIGAGGGGGNGDVNLDTNSGVVTRIKLSVDDDTLEVTENEAIDLIRGLPRSEENHATNGLELTEVDGKPILLIASGGHANAGAPSVNFVGLPEYTYSGAVLSADLNALAEIEAAKKIVDPNIDHVFDLPTLDDPTRPNFTDANGDDVWIDANFDGELDSVAEFVDQNGDGIADWLLDQDGDNDVDADDMADFVATKIVDADGDGVDDTILYQDGGSAEDNVTGVRGGNDALNQAKLLVGNPVQIFSSGYRNLYDVLKTEDGKYYAYDNGANGGWGGVAVTEDGVVTNAPNNVNQTKNFDNLHEFEQGYHAGHPNPTVASGSAAGLWTSPTTGPNSSETLPIADWRQLSDTPLPDIGQQDDGLVLPADWDQVVDPELIDPDAGVYNEGGSVADGALDADKGSWNGLAEYTGTAFGGQLEGAILVTQTKGDVKWIQRDQFGDIEVVAKGNGDLSNPNTTIEAKNQGLVGDTGGGNTLGIDAVGDEGVDGLTKFNNTVWVGSLGGSNKITVFEAGGEPAGADLDKDDDGVDHIQDYYDFSAVQGFDHVLDPQGTTTTVNAGDTRTYNLSAESYPLSAPGGIGQLGFMVNLSDPSAEGGLLSADENIIPGGAGSGLQIKDIRSGTAKGDANDQRDALTFAVTPGDDAGRLEISTVMNAILEGFYQDGSEAGLQIGTGDQFSFMSLVLAYSGTDTLEMVLHYEEGDAQQATESIDVSSLLQNIGGTERLPDTAVVEFLFDVNTISGVVTPKFKIAADGNLGNATFSEMAPVQASGDVLAAIQGDFTVDDEPHPLAFGNIGTSAIAPDATAQPIEDDNVNVTYDEFKVVGFAPQVDAFVVVSGAGVTVDEDAGTLSLDLSLEDEFGNPVTLDNDVVVDFTLAGTATAIDDFTLSLASPITIPANTSSVPFTLTIVDDEVPEADETIEITLGNIEASGLAVIPKAGQETSTITIDSDDAGNVLYRVNAGDAEIAADPSDPIQLAWVANTGTGPQSGDGFSVNTGNISTHNISGRDDSVPDYVPQAIFAKERWDPPANPAMTWSFDVEAGGTYTANIFAGNGFGGTSQPGERVFNIEVEGTEVFSNVDLSDQFGHQTGGLLSWTGTVLDDSLDIVFLGVEENPTVNGFEILELSGPSGSVAEVSVADVTVNEGDGTATVTFSLSAPVTEGPVTVPFILASDTATQGIDFSPSNGAQEVVFDGSQTATATILIGEDDVVEGLEDFTVSIDGASIAAPAEATVTVSATEGTATVTIIDNDVTPPAAGDVLYRVNTGGPLVTATDGGPDWEADTGAFGTAGNSPYLADAPTVSTTYNNAAGSSYDGDVETALGDAENVPLVLFDTERGDRGAAAPTLKYSFPVATDFGLAPGDEVEVRLYFAEIFGGIEDAGKDADGDGTPVGNRVFDVAVDGTVPAVFDDIDQFDAAGPNIGFVRSAVVAVDGDGNLDLEFLNGVENPAIKAIEIVVPGEASQEVTITAQDASADESTGEITITFTISEAVLDGEITVPFTLVSDTATVGTDTVPGQDGAVTFPAGDGSDQTVVITLVNDDLVEGDESFTVELGTPTSVPANVNVTTVDGTATIIDEDVAPVVDSFNDTSAPGDDWSDDNTAPDDVTLTEGTNTLVSAGAGGDADYITFTVAQGQQVTSITLTDYVGGGNSAFLGIQQGESVPSEADIQGGTATLDGGTVYNVVQVGQDLLPLLASTSVENAGQPTNGLTTPLEAGTYTLWFNQNGDLTESTLEIVSEAAVTTSPDDIDGDGTLNTDDPFAYDGSNGDDKVLTPGGEFTQDFNTDTTDPFSDDGGFSGILVNPAFDYPDASEADPYGVRTSGAPDVNISGGTLNVLSKQFDAFPTSGTGANNTLNDGYQSAVDVSSATTFEVHARASSADWLGNTTSTSGFEQFGITLGAGGVDDFVKLVVSDNNNNGNQPQRVQIAHNNSLVGGEQNFAWGSAAGPTVDLTLVGDVEFRLIVDRSAGANGQITGQVDFFADSDGSLLESFVTPPADILGGSSLLAAMDGQNPLTGGDGGLAYGIFVSDWGGGNQATNNQITANYDFLTVRSLDAPTDTAPTSVTLENVASLPENTDTTQPVKVADIAVVDDGVSAVALTLAGADQALFEISGDALFLKAGIPLDFETQTDFDVSVVATDAAGSAASTALGTLVTDSDTRDLPPADEPSGLPDGEEDGTDEVDTVEYTGSAPVGAPEAPYELPESVENFDATGDGTVNVKGTSQDNVIGVGSGAGDTVDLTDGGSDVVTGTGAELDGTNVTGFGVDDALVVENADDNASVVAVTAGSTILGLDTTGDGNVDTTVTLEEDYTPEQIVGTVIDGALVITANPAPTVFTTTLQAVDLTITDTDGDSTVRSPSNPENTPTGNGKANGIWINSVDDEYLDLGNDIGDTAQFIYNASSAGEATLTFRYANGGNGDRPMIIAVNGVQQGDPVQFSPTLEWFEWEEVSTTIALVSGENVISFATTIKNGPNIDQVVLETEVAPAADAAPTFDVAPTAATVQENTTDVVADFDATDPDGTPVVFSLAGDDAGAFDIDADTGELAFDPAPDFETPTDTGADNVYNVDVVATSGNLSTSTSIEVTVEDLPSALSNTFDDGDTGVDIGTGFNFGFDLVDSVGIDNTTIDATTVKIIEVATGNEVPSASNGSGGFDALSVTPLQQLDPNTEYSIVIDGVLDQNGRPLERFEASFTTGADDGGPVDPLEPTFTVSEQATGVAVTSLEISPDGTQLYAASFGGTLYRWDIDPATGELSNETTFNGLAGNAIIGIAFDPNNPNDLWLTKNLPVGNQDDFTGEIVRLTLDPQTSAFDGTLTTMVTGLPRSVSDHLTNSIEFNADGEMFLVQGGNTASGAADGVWGDRDERLLSAAVLKVDHTAIAAEVTSSGQPYDVTTDVQDFNSGQNGEQGTPADQRNPDGSVPGFYNPFANDALVTIHATGVRNAYDLAWHSNGNLYVPTNGTGSVGNVPDDPATAFDESTVNSGAPKPDLLFKSSAEGGEYFGHPNATRGEYIAFGGNPTPGADPQEINGYPVGTQPDENFTEAAFIFNNGASANGTVEFTSEVFNGALKGALLVARFSNGDDIRAFELDANGDVVGNTALKDSDGNDIKFANPLDVVTDASGRVYVIEFQRNNPSNSSIELLTPNAPPVATAEIEIGGLTEVATDDRIVFSGVDTVENGTQNADIANQATVTVSNTGTEDLVVSSIGITGEFELADAGQAGGFTVAPGSSVDVTVNFTATTQAVFEGTLTINSNDADEGTKTIALAGYNQPQLEGGDEPSVAQILEVFGFQTDLGDVANRDGDDGAAGDEVISAYWEAADSGAPVTVTQIAAYTGPRDYQIQWFAENPQAQSANDLTINSIFAHAESDSHTLLPDTVENDGPARDPATGSFTPSGPFGFSIFWNGDTDYTDPAFQTQDKGETGNEALPGGDILMRMFQLVGADGQPVPNTYLLLQDYQAVNFDWNDNVYIVSNVQPAGSGPDAIPTAQIVVNLPTETDGDIVVTATFADDNAIDDATVEASDLTLSGPSVPGTPVFAYNAANDTATWTYAAPAEGWADGAYTATLQADSVSDDAGQGIVETSEAVTLDLTPTQPGELIAAINVGSDGNNGTPFEYVRPSDGTVFVADPGPSSQTGTSETNFRPNMDFVGTEDDPLYASYRFSENNTSDSFTYSIDVPQTGTYDVTLYIAEIFFNPAGSRVYDILAEDVLIADDLDPVVAFGPVEGGTSGTSTPGTIEFEIEVTDGTLDLTFADDVANNALVNAIEVRAAEVATPVSSAAFGVIAGSNNINASTFGNTSFTIENTGETAITQVVFDLDSGILPDIVFDPNGAAGDATAKGFTPNAGSGAATGASAGFSDANEGGFYTLTIDFTDFQPGETLTFGLDTDPTSVKGQSAPGVGESGSVSGLEMAGTGLAVNFDDGTTLTSSLFEDGSNAGATAVVATDAPAAPTISLVGGSTFSTVGDASQNILITGTPGAEVRLLQVEGAMFEPANGGFDVEPFEANSIIGREPALTGTLDGNGELEVQVTLTDTPQSPGNGTAVSGLNHFMAVVDGADGQTSATSNTLVVEYDADLVEPGGAGATIEVTADEGIDASTDTGGAFAITNDGPAKISEISIDLSTALLPDMVFDPQGNIDGSGLGLTPVNGAGATGYIAPSDPTGEVGGGSTGSAFQEQNGIVVIEMESAGNLPGAWETIDTYSTTTAPNVNNPTGATGGDFIIWQAGQSLGNPGNGLIEYEVEITNPGLYQFQWRNQVGLGTNTTEHNDTWLKINADQFYGIQGNPISSTNFVQPKGAAPGTFPDGSDIPEGAGSGGWFKVYSSGANNWSWSTNTSDNDAHQIFAEFDAPGTYTIEVSQRSSNHAIDRMVLHQVSPDDFSGNPLSTSLPESPLASGAGEGPFSQARGGGYDVVTLAFDDFDQGETFTFDVDTDPASIEGLTAPGSVGDVSGYELIGATVTLTYDNGETDTVTLSEDGSLGGAEAVSDTATQLLAPSIALVGFADAVPDGTDGGDRQQAVVPEVGQTVLVTGTPGAYFALLQMDAELVPSNGTGLSNVGASELPFYANAATDGKTLYTGQFDSNGEASVDVTLPDGGDASHFIAVTSNVPYAPGVEVSATSNAVVATFDPNATLGGSAILTINEDSNGIETSNFGNGSFSITNNGTEAISFIEIDVTDAVLVDAVFDPFGLAGDSTGKVLTPGAGAAAVGLVTPTGGFDEDAIGITYLGDGETDPLLGFETIRLEFTDFAPGETFSFGIDMDPNSIAGSSKSTLDSGAPLAGAGGGSNPVWDVGGVGGAELSGGLFTVGYADGGTSTGKLHGQGTGQQMGAKALSAENTTNASNVTLTVNGLTPGAEGTYGDGGPTIEIQGEAGQTARVLVMKGFIVPFTNEFTNAYAAQLDAQLAALEASGFPANNAVEMQYVDIELTGDVQDISDQFDFTQVADFDLSVPDATNEFGVLEEDKLPLGIVASVIDPDTDLPQGEVTSPIHLTFSDVPTADLSLDKTVSDANPDFGDQVVFTVTVTNDGPDAASNVEVLDTLGNGFAFVEAEGDGAYDDASGVWTIDTLDASASQTLTVTATVLEGGAAAPDEVVYRINAGGATQVVGVADATDASEPDWIGSGPVGNGAGPFTVTDGVTVAVGTDFGNNNTIGNGAVPDDIDLTAVAGTDAAIEALYRTERFGDTQWEFAVDPGEYTVNLFFAEIFQGVQGTGANGGAGDRLFNVTIEDVQVLSSYDVFDVAGGGRIATLESFDVTSDEILDIDFTTVEDNAKISAIEIIKKGDVGALDYTNTVEVVAAEQPDPDSTPGNGVGNGEDDEASVTVAPIAGGINLVTLAAVADASEPGTNGQFVVTLEEAADTITTVTYTVAGTALGGTDYAALTGTLEIAAGETEGVIDVTVLDDLEFEGDETVEVTLTAASGDENLQLGTEVVATVTIADDEVPPIDGSALIEITPNGSLGATTFGGSDKVQITNNGPADIKSISIDFSTGILPDMVWDPTGSGGDATAQAFTAGGTAADVGLVTPGNPGPGVGADDADPFSQPRNGGWDVITLNFTDFNQGEFFSFTSDVDPNSIQGIPNAGFSGAVSGYELVGSTITVTFTDGTSDQVVVSSLYEDGSLGGGQSEAVIATNTALSAPTIELLGAGADESSLPGSQHSVAVGETVQTVRVTGEAGANVSLLQMDARLFINGGVAPFDVTSDELPFYANEAMSGKTLYDAVIGEDGFVDIEVALLTTPDTGGDGGLNHFVAVLSDAPYQVDTAVSQTSNTLIVRQSDDVVPNTAPEITSADTFDFAEEKAGEVFVATATDAEDDPVTFSIDGGDAGLFSVNETTGSVSFTNPSPEFVEDGDNLYTFDLTASDGELFTTQTVSVEIINDTDGDGFHDGEDNVILLFNPDQRDTDGDGLGNRGDADLNQSGNVDIQDLQAFSLAFNQPVLDDTGAPILPAANADFNGDGAVNTIDLGIFASLFDEPLGPTAFDDIA